MEQNVCTIPIRWMLGNLPHPHVFNTLNTNTHAHVAKERIIILVFVKCNDHTKSILHAFGFDALALVNVNFPGLFPRLLQVNVHLCLFHLVARQSLYFKHLMMLLLLPSHLALTVRSVYSFW